MLTILAISEAKKDKLSQNWDQPGLYKKHQAGQNYIVKPCFFWFFFFLTKNKNKREVRVLDVA